MLVGLLKGKLLTVPNDLFYCLGKTEDTENDKALIDNFKIIFDKFKEWGDNIDKNECPESKFEKEGVDKKKSALDRAACILK